MLFSIALVDHHLREGDLHAVVVEKDLQIPRQHALAGEHILLRHIHREFQVHAAVSQLIHAEIARCREIQVRMLFLQIRQACAADRRRPQGRANG